MDTSKLLGSVASYYSSTDGKLIAMPFNASTTVLYYNKDAVKKAGGDPDHFPTTWLKWPNSQEDQGIRRVQVRPHLRLAVLGAA